MKHAVDRGIQPLGVATLIESWVFCTVSLQCWFLCESFLGRSLHNFTAARPCRFCRSIHPIGTGRFNWAHPVLMENRSLSIPQKHTPWDALHGC